MKRQSLSSSFKDPSGFVFFDNNRLLRQVNFSYKKNYDFFIKSGLYQELVSEKILVAHKEIKFSAVDDKAYKIIEPQKIPFISYPYEWSFSQLKDAAALTLKIQKKALEKGMTLKDASNFNVQFNKGRPVFIDTLSFEIYEKGKPWIAYKQFCEHFIAPLSLQAFNDVRLSKLLLAYIDGLPLDLTTQLLPFPAKLKPFILIHIILHAKTQKKYSDKPLQTTGKSFSKQLLLELIKNLENGIKSLKLKTNKTTWSNYYVHDTAVSYKKQSFDEKVKLVSDYLDLIKPKTLWDIGANNGFYSRLSAKKGIFTVSMDFDPLAIEYNYLKVKQDKEENILPLIIDLIQPSPSIGWENKERSSIFARHLPDTVMALALVHHLAITNNLPLPMLAKFFARISKSLIIEFVAKEDKQTQILLKSREDIFPEYTCQNFEKEFRNFFTIKKALNISGSKRTLYLMVNKKKQ